MLKLVYRSTTPAVSLEEMVDHLRRSDTDEDDHLIERYTDAATRWAENFMGLSIVDTTWDYYFDYPDGLGVYGREIKIPRGPLLEVSSVFYRDGGEGEFSGYLVDYEYPRVYLDATGNWPTVDSAANNGRIRFRAGFVDESSPGIVNEVPEDIKAAIQLYAGNLYEVRSHDDPMAISTRPPWGAEILLRQYRIATSMA
jgi:uncharacterized phiE125 gp8 family phage protein